MDTKIFAHPAVLWTKSGSCFKSGRQWGRKSSDPSGDLIHSGNGNSSVAFLLRRPKRQGCFLLSGNNDS